MRITDNSTYRYSTEGRHIFQNEDETFSSYYDGYVQNYNCQDYESALSSLFPESSHGYEIEYFIDDGNWLDGPYCGTCASQIWSNDEFQYRIISELVTSDRSVERAVYCDQCSKEIAEQVCQHCYLPLSDTPYGRYAATFYDGNYTCLHAHCVADLIVEGAATKEGLGLYRVRYLSYGTDHEGRLFLDLSRY